MITHVIVELEHPIEEDWMRDYSDEYYGIGTPLIRCKDCKYYRIYKHPDWTVELCGRIRTTMADPVKEDDYCSKAERKDT